MRHRVGAVALAALALLAACKGESPNPATAMPRAEFLFAAGDSTYWVHSSADGLRVRSAPILLTQVDGKLFEVFLSDDGAEYVDASFASSQLWARALGGRDSVRLFGDSTVLRELRSWRTAHPNETEIDPNDEQLEDDPRTMVHDEIEILDVHGPYLTFEHLLNVDIDGGPPHRHEGRRFVVDVRSGRLMRVADLLGAPEAQRVIAEAQQSLARLTDSIRTAGQGGDERAAAAVETLGSFVFDSSSFGITDLGREPAIAFMVPGKSADGEALALHLPPLKVTAPGWWAAVRATLPTWTADSSRVRWSRGRYDVMARPSADGDALALVLMGTGVTAKEWPVSTVGSPAYQLIALDDPPLDSAGRSALARTFDVSAALDGMAQRAVYQRPATPTVPHARAATRFIRTRHD
ncbi:MAG: hypothetical protein K2R93_00445 [Gemmatimonadaceae bacterium]|nr:hypothetical protein [Gemmatimonadaceae bacterium]